MFRRRKDRNHFWAVAGMGCVAVIALVLGLLQFARQSDNAAKLREQTVVTNGFVARTHEIEALVVPQVIWDEAVRNLDNRFNLGWAQENIGTFLNATDDFQFAYIIASDGRTVYAMRDGNHVAPATFNDLASVTQPIFAAVRKAEAKRSRTQNALQDPIQSSMPTWIDGQLYIVTATLVQSDFGHAQIMNQHAPIVVTGRALDDAFMQSFSERYLLSGLHLHEGDSRSEPLEAHAAIIDDRGADIATLDWLPQRPGTRLLGEVMPWMVMIVVALLLATLIFYMRARRQAKQLADSEQRSLHMAYHDALTGICNRAYFEMVLNSQLSSAAQNGERYAVHCLDLDRFKELNDTYGHQSGDELLKLAAARLKALCTDDAVCARLGGDEFAVLQPIYDEIEATAFAERIVASLSAPFSLNVGEKVLGCSVGTAMSGAETADPFEMLRRADMALYRAKGEGRGCHRLYNSEMDELLKAMRRLKEDLRRDLNAGKLTMVYQPQVRLSGEVVGLEALIRWNHPEQGPISPSIFVPLAEESGLIKQLGEFTLRQAALDSLRWPDMKVAVNVSATQIQMPDFAARAKEIVEGAGAACSNIEIELTEGVLFSNEEETHATLDALHEAGFSIALDDFGTGYSSLSYLQRFPIDKIKIDRSFVTSLGQEAKADALFTAIVKLANALEMRVIAEGVETAEQWLRLTRAGCSQIQGFIAARPLAATDVATFLEQSSDPNAARPDPELLAAAS